VRYRVTDIVDGKPQRGRVSARLCYKDSAHPSAGSRAVKLLRDKFMRSVNETAPDAQQDVLIVDFWDRTYEPYFAKEKRSSTVDGYRQIWAQFLRDHFAGRTLREYRTHHGSQFLTNLAKKLVPQTREQRYGRRTLAHIRSLASGLFTHAKNIGVLETPNPWHEVKILTKVKDPANTPHYTLEQVENIISALVDRVDAQLIVALSFFAGLRPSEIAGLQWGDLDSEFVHIRRACVRGVVGDCKTPESAASLPLLPQVRLLVELWRLKSGNPTQGWVFPNNSGRDPVNLRDFVHRAVLPALRKRKIVWKGLYAGRRGAGTILVDLTGNLVAAQELLRHKSLMTTAMFYKKTTQNALPEGMRLLGAAATKTSA
jgi:integrase